MGNQIKKLIIMSVINYIHNKELHVSYLVR